MLLRNDYGEHMITLPDEIDGRHVRIGCDVAAIDEVQDSLATFGERYLRKVFTASEISDCEGRNQVHRLAARFAAGDEPAVSDACRLECLVGPYRAGDVTLLHDYTAFLADPALHVLPVTIAIWERPARIRAAHRFQALYSVHLAATVEHGCGLFLTNDAHLARFPDLPVEVLT